MTKKPAQLSDSLLTHRPRKGEARPQSETDAYVIPASQQSDMSPVRRRRGVRSLNTIQLNMKVRPDVADQFTALADKENLIFGDLLERLIRVYERSQYR